MKSKQFHIASLRSYLKFRHLKGINFERMTVSGGSSANSATNCKTIIKCWSSCFLGVTKFYTFFMTQAMIFLLFGLNGEQ